MKKDFDGWNNLKKITNDKPDGFGVHEREIRLKLESLRLFKITKTRLSAGLLGGRSHNQLP